MASLFMSLDCKRECVYPGFVLSNGRHRSCSRIAFERKCSSVSQSQKRPSFSTLCIMHPRKIFIKYATGADVELRPKNRTLPITLRAVSQPTFDFGHGIAKGVGPNHLGATASESEVEDEAGPQELQPNMIEIDPFSMPEATPLQTAASVALTGAITVLLLRSLRRRSQRSKELKFRSNAVERLDKKAPEPVVSGEEEKPPPSALNTLAGAAVAALISYILYNFTTGVEDQFSLKAVSTNYSVRNLTITVRTIITGMCWLGTFVFGANAIGLTLYAGQLALGLNPEAMDSPDIKREDVVPSKEEDREQ